MTTNAKGFTLIESVIVIVLLGFAALTLSSFLVPQSAQSSDANYYNRAAALGGSVMSRLLAQSYNDIDAFNGETDLSNLIKDASTYSNFQIEVSIEAVSGASNNLKSVIVDVTASTQPTVTFSAFKGNY
ncbi:prepilin-type cleavage/methylation domain-containing protein [Vibrio splendidus]|uniref:Prepilin-type cleavage/methylation domain-containing protein n=1 Tax=Vibrio splendidus TaxID=29497 RepID=A0A2T5EXK1_VIBSP|nr:type II secretion system protein [Vibrio splendidus]OEF77778.1 prepilin-type N-terminal cleavage/methylation domain-containing protein [Vibrio splendidus 1F-157]PMH93579.1 prepilin-type N-terminal cleavage/methylation domain-containing protein [Vibrio splendidus]PMJ49779.1 prepilin-type N-terminal cleavage/methylation domain-containing protein [Vibrio splendidus]PTP37025.1 prepilin-type cleavage/methylation domain-containing protein [Vibrio splendidus]PTP77683.1 prepilin-type cleavage/methy